MAYFSQDFIAFFKELSANNYREWFHENKKRYEDHVKNPFKDFVQLMIDRVQEVDRNVVLTPKDAIFRINRDIRFSKDKTPYKTNVSAVISSGGRKNASLSDGMYIEFGAEHASIYGGAYMLDKNQLQLVREAIASNLEEFANLLKAEEFATKFGSLHGDEHKRLPKEFKEVAAVQPLIFKKSFYFFSKFEPSIILKDDLPEILMDYYEAGRPVANFLAKAMQEAA